MEGSVANCEDEETVTNEGVASEREVVINGADNREYGEPQQAKGERQ